MATMKDNKFLRDYHNKELFSAPSEKPKNSLIDPNDMPYVSAQMYAHQTAYGRPGESAGLYTCYPSRPAEMVPGGQMTATGLTPHYYATPYATHLMGLDEQTMLSDFGYIPGYSANTGEDL